MGLLDSVIGSVLGQVLGQPHAPEPEGRQPQAPHPGPAPAPGGSQGQSLTPLVLAIMALLGWRALDHRSRGQARGGPESDADDAGGGGLGDILGQVLGRGRHPSDDEIEEEDGEPERRGDPALEGLGGYLDNPREAGGRSGADAHRQRRRPGRGGLFAPDTDDAGELEGEGGFAGGLDRLRDLFAQHGRRDDIESWIGPGQNRAIAAPELEQALGPETVDTLVGRTGLDRDTLLAQLSRVLPEVIDRLTPHGRPPTAEETRRW